MTEPKISPVPWTVKPDADGMGWIEAADGIDCTCYGASERTPEENRANGAFIVRAVNSHQALVEALKWALKRIETSLDTGEHFEKASAALKAAES